MIKTRVVKEEIELPYGFGDDVAVIDNHHAAGQLFQRVIGEYADEHSLAVYLDAKLRVLGMSVVSIGSRNQATMDPVSVFRPALLMNACNVIVGHNHPSGDVSPSQSDIDTTKKLVGAGGLLNIALSDHIICSAGDSFSIRSEYPEIWNQF